MADVKSASASATKRGSLSGAAKRSKRKQKAATATPAPSPVIQPVNNEERKTTEKGKEKDEKMTYSARDKVHPQLRKHVDGLMANPKDSDTIAKGKQTALWDCFVKPNMIWLCNGMGEEALITGLVHAHLNQHADVRDALMEMGVMQHDSHFPVFLRKLCEFIQERRVLSDQYTKANKAPDFKVEDDVKKVASFVHALFETPPNTTSNQTYGGVFRLVFNSPSVFTVPKAVELLQRIMCYSTLNTSSHERIVDKEEEFKELVEEPIMWAYARVFPTMRVIASMAYDISMELLIACCNLISHCCISRDRVALTPPQFTDALQLSVPPHITDSDARMLLLAYMIRTPLKLMHAEKLMELRPELIPLLPSSVCIEFTFEDHDSYYDRFSALISSMVRINNNYITGVQSMLQDVLPFAETHPLMLRKKLGESPVFHRQLITDYLDDTLTRLIKFPAALTADSHYEKIQQSIRDIVSMNSVIIHAEVFAPLSVNSDISK